MHPLDNAQFHPFSTNWFFHKHIANSILFNYSFQIKTWMPTWFPNLNSPFKIKDWKLLKSKIAETLKIVTCRSDIFYATYVHGQTIKDCITCVYKKTKLRNRHNFEGQVDLVRSAHLCFNWHGLPFRQLVAF